MKQADSAEVQGLIVLGMLGQVLFEQTDGFLKVRLRVIQFLGLQEKSF